MKKGTFASFCSCAVLAASLCVDVSGMRPGEDQGGNSGYEKINKLPLSENNKEVMMNGEEEKRRREEDGGREEDGDRED